MDNKNDPNNQKSKKPLKKQKTMKNSNYSSKNYEIDKHENKSSRSGNVIAKSEGKSLNSKTNTVGRPPKHNLISASPPKKTGTSRNNNI